MIKNLKKTKNKKLRACTVGANYGQKDTKDQKTSTATSEEPGAKTGCWEQKQGTEHAPCTQHHQTGGRNT